MLGACQFCSSPLGTNYDIRDKPFLFQLFKTYSVTCFTIILTVFEVLGILKRCVKQVPQFTVCVIFHNMRFISNMKFRSALFYS